MLGYTSVSRGLILLATVAACSPRTLALVDLLSDAGLAPHPVDATPTGSPDGATAAGLLRGLVGLWHCDDGAGSDVVRDSSGNGNNGKLVGLDPALAWTPGRRGSALATNAAGYAVVDDSASIDGITAQVTISAWVYFDGAVLVDYGTALSRQIENTDLQYYHLSIDVDGVPTLFLGMGVNGPITRVPAPQPIARMRWTHLAGTYDGARAVVYVDGFEANSRPIAGTFALDTTPVVLGGNGNKDVGITEWFPGRIDELALYDRALRPDEIGLLARAVAF